MNMKLSTTTKNNIMIATVKAEITLKVTDKLHSKKDDRRERERDFNS